MGSWRPTRAVCRSAGDSWAVISKATIAATKEQVLFAHKGLFRDNLSVNDVSADGKLILLQFGRPPWGNQTCGCCARATTPEPYSQDTPSNWTRHSLQTGNGWPIKRSDVGQRPNVYVQPYPATGSKSQISRDVGFKPLWSSDGKELFFLNDDGLMAAPMANGFLVVRPGPVSNAGRGGNAGRRSTASLVVRDSWSTLRSRNRHRRTLTVTTNWLAARK